MLQLMLDGIDTTNDTICDIRRDIREFNEGRERIEEMDIKVNYPKHFSTLCLDDILSVELFKIMKECENEEKEFDVDDDLDIDQPSMIFQPTKPFINEDAKDEEMVLDSKKNQTQTS